MRAALEGEQASPARPARAEATHAFLAAPLLAGAALVLLAAAVLVGGGTSDTPLAWIGGGAVLVASAGFGAVALGHLPAPKLSTAGRLSVLLFAVFVVWNGASVVWSILPDRSWDYANRGLAYFAFLAVGLLLGACLRRAPQQIHPVYVRSGRRLSQVKTGSGPAVRVGVDGRAGGRYPVSGRRLATRLVPVVDHWPLAFRVQH